MCTVYSCVYYTRTCTHFTHPFRCLPAPVPPFNQMHSTSTTRPLMWRSSVLLYYLHFVCYCTHVRMSYVLNSYLLTYLLNLWAVHTWCGPSANLGCRYEMCCTQLAENTRRKKVAKNCHLRTIAQLCQAISSQLRHISTIGKNLLSSHTSSTCPHNMANFGPLTAEIGWPVWGTPANFNWFRVLAVLLHGI